MARRFALSDPAPDVLTLVDHLERERREGDLYRGQTRDFPALIPSACRRAVVPGTESEPVVPLDPDREESSRRDTVRSELLSRLIGTLGIATGNLVAQQYGVSSECLDATENLRIAAYFATRTWPEFAHAAEPGIGVIYRFRPTAADPVPTRSDLASLNLWFQMGERDGVVFDWFVRERELPLVFDRDRWMDWSAGTTAIVSTMPLSLPWAAVSRALQVMAANVPAAGRFVPTGKLADAASAVDWRWTRVAKQDGGFVKPRFYWEALVPERYDVRPSADPIARQRAVPSAAVRRRLIGVENVRYREGFDAFYFRHGQARVTGLYRRELWPEPSEDPLFQVMWMQSLVHMRDAYPDPVAVDDPDEGLLDRGYRVAGERLTMDGRELDDLMRGQLEDAHEATADETRATAHDWVWLAAAHAYRGESAEALRAARRAVDRDADSPEALFSLAELLTQQGEDVRAQTLVGHAVRSAPDHPMVLLHLADRAFADGDYAAAASRVDRVLADFDPAVFPVYTLLERRAILAGVLGDDATLGQMLDRYANVGFNPAPLRGHIDRLRSAAQQSRS